MAKKVWDYDNRMLLKAFLNDGYRASDIAKKLDVYNKTVYDELKKGLDKEVEHSQVNGHNL